MRSSKVSFTRANLCLCGRENSCGPLFSLILSTTGRSKSSFSLDFTFPIISRGATKRLYLRKLPQAQEFAS